MEFTGQKVFSLFKQMGVTVMKVGDESYAYISRAYLYPKKDTKDAQNTVSTANNYESQLNKR